MILALAPRGKASGFLSLTTEARAFRRVWRGTASWECGCRGMRSRPEDRGRVLLMLPLAVSEFLVSAAVISLSAGLLVSDSSATDSEDACGDVAQFDAASGVSAVAEAVVVVVVVAVAVAVAVAADWVCSGLLIDSAAEDVLVLLLPSAGWSALEGVPEPMFMPVVAQVQLWLLLLSLRWVSIELATVFADAMVGLLRARIDLGTAGINNSDAPRAD